MKQFFKIGATAMALALSVTMVSPLTANAELYAIYEKDANGQTIKTYYDDDTKKSLSEKEFVINNPSVIEAELKTKTITTDSYNETESFTTTYDVARFDNFRSSNKALKVKVISRLEQDNKDYGPDYKSKDENTLYYKNVNGDIVSVDASKAETALPKGKEYATYIVRFYTKKTGTYKVKYDAILKDGSKVTKSFKVIAKADGDPIKSITYGGLNVGVSTAKDKDPGNRVWAKGFGYDVTTKKSGVLKVVMNPDFKLKKLEVGTPSIKYTPVDEKNGEEMRMDYTEANSSLDKHDGKTISWKKTKNGKKIKLSTVDDGYAEANITYRLGWKFGKKSETTFTYIRVTYYDKKNKKTYRPVFPIQLVQE